MTAGQDLLAPKPSKLKSSLFTKPPPEEPVTPILSNLKPPLPSPSPSPSPSGRPPLPTAPTSLKIDVPQKRPSNPSKWSPRVLSPKGTSKSPSNSKQFTFNSFTVQPPKSPLRSPKGLHKSPKTSTKTFDFADENSPPTIVTSPRSKFGFDVSPPRDVVTPSKTEFHNMFSPKGEVRRSKNREKKDKNRASDSSTDTETEVWHSVPKKTVNKMGMSLKDGGMGHSHPNAKK
ncbi:hypothetical protein TrLO_g5705 [Triparma laevis f. longispina]|nr:hypothetical protein TrLO_g5705 [Triparma laevis f. longispina]